jgi:hypothetical protein
MAVAQLSLATTCLPQIWGKHFTALLGIRKIPQNGHTKSIATTA